LPRLLVLPEFQLNNLIL